jgi:penicillin-binding protein 2
VKKKTKFGLLRASIVALFVILGGRLWYVQVVMGSYYKQQADTSKIRIVPVEALRGIIYDQYGRQLVRNAPSWRLEVVPHGVPSRSAWQIYRMLSRILGGRPSPAQIAQTVQVNEWHPYVGSLVPAQVSDQAAMVIKQLHYELPGVRVEPSGQRAYQGDAGFAISHILGYTTGISSAALQEYRRIYPRLNTDLTDQAGATGIEAMLDPYLHGVNGRELVEVDAGERPVRVLRAARTVPGDRVYLTIDWKLQRQVSSDLQAALAKLGLSQGVAIMEEVNTGRILAMASFPSFNDNAFAQSDFKQENAILKDPANPLLNLATQGQFPPGSTYKVVTAAAALQTGVVNADTTYDDTGSIKLCATGGGCQVFNGWASGGLGSVNVVSALQKSSDIFFYTVSGGNPNIGYVPHVGPDRLAKYARLFGLGSPTGIELPGEQGGNIPDSTWFEQHYGQPWHVGDSYNVGIGQGDDLVTPLQMVNVAATIANGGTLYQPRIVDHVAGRIVPRKGVLARERTILPFVPTPVHTGFIDPGNLALIQAGMHQSVDATPAWQGTSYLAQDPRIDAAGKTGTAEVYGKAPHAWWLGYAPFNHPRVAVVVMVPNADSEGAYVGAPIGHKLLEDYFHLKPYLVDHPADTNWLDDVIQSLVGSGGH